VAEPAAPWRRLGVELQRLRSQSKLTQREVAAGLGWCLPKVIRIEHGAARLRVTDLRVPLELYRVSDPHSGHRDILFPKADRSDPYMTTTSREQTWRLDGLATPPDGLRGDR